MGQACCSNQYKDEKSELNSRTYQGATVGGKTFSANDIYMIVRLQSAFRGWMARKRVQDLRASVFNVGMTRSGPVAAGQEDYDNVSV